MPSCLTNECKIKKPLIGPNDSKLNDRDILFNSKQDYNKYVHNELACYYDILKIAESNQEKDIIERIGSSEKPIFTLSASKDPFTLIQSPQSILYPKRHLLIWGNGDVIWTRFNTVIYAKIHKTEMEPFIQSVHNPFFYNNKNIIGEEWGINGYSCFFLLRSDLLYQYYFFRSDWGNCFFGIPGKTPHRKSNSNKLLWEDLLNTFNEMKLFNKPVYILDISGTDFLDYIKELFPELYSFNFEANKIGN